MEKQKKKNSTLKILLKTIKLRRLVFLVVLISANTLAWFVYNNKVESDINVHVRAWNVVFKDGNTPLTDYINIEVDSLYPGTDFEKVLTIYNESEVAAELEYDILSARILGTTYTTYEGVLDAEGTPTGDEPTSAEVEEMLASDYPFAITMNMSNNAISAEDGEESFTLNADWPFESGDDELDTYWGKEAHSYKQSNPNTPSIAVRIKIHIEQENENS